MTETRQPVWPLVLMFLWYALLLVGIGFAGLIVLSFGSEAYRTAGIPAHELLPVAIPFVLVIIAALATILLWNSGKRNFAYALCAATFLPIVFFIFGERIQNSIDRFGERFENRVFTDIERAKARKRPFTIAGTYAKRFAAKEAFSKAVGTGFRRGVFMKDIGVVNAPSGAPTLALEGGAAKRLAELTPDGHEVTVHLTLTDDHPWAQAFVILEANPV